MRVGGGLRPRAAVLAGSVAAVLVAGCHASGSEDPAASHSACSDLGGTIGSDDFCEYHSTTATSRIAIRFPSGYPDQQSVGDYLVRSRTEFLDFVGSPSTRPRPAPFELDVIGMSYRSGDAESGTKSLVLTIGNDTGVHPVTTFKAFNYSRADHEPITVDMLFKPGSDPLAVLNPIVRQQALKRDPQATAAANGLTMASYQQFAITDDAIIFFFNQDGLLPHEDGPLQVTVRRSELASILR